MYVFRSLVDRSSLSPGNQTTVTQWVRYVSKTHYEILGLQRTASPDEIRKAFLELSKQLHPDVNARDPKTHDKFVKLNEAYTVLSKLTTKRNYDLTLASRVYRSQQTGQYGRPSSRPGSNYYQGDGEERVFWDESIYHMRDRSKDKQYQDAPYYGIRGIKKQPNSYIVLACFGFMAIGIVLHVTAIRMSRKMHKKALDEKDKKAHAVYTAAKTQARINGNVEQLRILQARYAKTIDDDLNSKGKGR